MKPLLPPLSALIALALLSAATPAHAQTDTDTSAVWAQVFAGAYLTSQDVGPSSRAELTRAQLGSHFTLGSQGSLDLVLESVRSAGPASLTGIDGDSLIIRAREVWGHAEGELGRVQWHVGAGLIPDRWRQALETSYGIRALSPTEEILRDALPTADLGARGELAWQGAWAAVQVTNGEGLNESEQNDAKALEGILGYHLDLARWLDEGSVDVAGGYRVADRGVAAIPSDLTFAHLTVSTPWARVGGAYSHAESTYGRPDVASDLLTFWADGEVLPTWLGVAARVGRWDPEGYDNAANRYLGALYTDFGDLNHSARLFVYGERRAYQPSAVVAPGVPAIQDEDRYGVMLDLRGRFAPESD